MSDAPDSALLACDVAVIGAGTAGLAAERAARQQGAKTLLIDPAFTGPTCTRVGCMPSKLLIAAGDAAHAVGGAGLFGVEAAIARIDGPAVMARVRGERDRFTQATLDTIAKVPAEIRIKASARFLDATTLGLDDGRRVQARAVVIATGSHPAMPEPFEALGELALTNETVFDLADLPRRLAVVGAGPLGLELAQAFARLGVEVVVFDAGQTLCGLKDEACAAELRRALERELKIVLGVELDASRHDGAARLSWSGAAGEGRAVFDRVLVSTGRPPNLEGLDLAAAGLELDDKGVPRFDPETMRCGESAVFLAGDADASRNVLHEASSEGAIAGGNAALNPRAEPADRGPAFALAFTDPNVAVVGQPPGEATVTGEASYRDQGRARVEGRNTGLVRLHADKADGRLTGAVMVGPAMEHMSHLLAWAIARGETATALLSLPFYHPTLEEGLKPALRDICTAVNSPLPHDRDEGIAPGS